MRITPAIAAVAAAAFLAAGLTACSAEQKTIELEIVESAAPEVEESADGAVDWDITSDLIEDFPEADAAALTALSERLDAAAPSAEAVAIRVSIFEEGKVIVRIFAADSGSTITVAELKSILAELKGFTGSPVDNWLVEMKDLEDFYVDMDELAAEAGLPAEWDGGWGDLEIPAAQLASFV